ncbi:MAG TPA: peptidylprolyl isomerase [Pyrinomonadaceae bacterium]|nr:peptidylprolyl isomerase [Pyrinomonadaceae bacterium]
MNRYLIVVLFLVLFSFGAYSQVPLNTAIQILKAEDARNWNPSLESLLKSQNPAIRERAALAAGRIGDKRAIPALSAMAMESENLGKVISTVVFALGEIEATEGGATVLDIIKAESGFSQRDGMLLSRAVEAAGKIVAANAKDESLKDLKAAIIRVIEDELKSPSPKREVLLAASTVVVRARPEGGDAAVIKMLSSDDNGVRADALNTLVRLRAKLDTKRLTDIIMFDKDDLVRVNAIRLTAAGELKDFKNLLIAAATTDVNHQIRVAATRSLAGLKDAPDAATALIKRGSELLIPIHGDPAPLKPGQKAVNLKPVHVPLQKNELLEIATAVGRMRAGTDDKEALAFLNKLNERDKYSSPETFVAIARVSSQTILQMPVPKAVFTDFRAAAAYGMGLSELATLKSDDMNSQAGQKLTHFIARMATDVTAKDQNKMMMAMPDLMRSLAALKPDNLDEILRGQIANEDVFLRAAAAELLSERPFTKENFDAIQKAFTVSMIRDKHDNDAMMAILDALAKLDKSAATGSLLMALNSRDYLVRKKAFELLEDKELEKTSPGIPFMLKQSREKGQDKVQPYLSAFGTRLGQILNSDIDYRRALSRKNGSVKAVLTTEKGSFTIVFNPEEAPLTVDNWVKLARLGYFNGLAVHRVVPNFVMQDGDPRGDGNGGPGWSIRCEVNMLLYDRGAVGMALSGKDTGGSQWFVTHVPTPHLDGGYTVFGHVSETDMKVVDSIARGDKILNVTIVGR